MGSVKHFLYQKLVLFVWTFWVSVSTYVLALLGFLRFKTNKSSLTNETKCSELPSEENHQNRLNCDMPEPEPESESESEDELDSFILKDAENDEIGEKEITEFCFKFKFPTFEEFSKSHGGGDSDFLSSEVLSGKSFSSFIEENELASPSVEEVNKGTRSSSLGESEIFEDGFLSDTDFGQVHLESEAVCDKFPEKIEAITFTDDKPQTNDSEDDFHGDQDQVHHPENDSFIESDLESMNLSHMQSVMSHLIDSYSDDGFLSDGDFGGEFESDDTDGEKLELDGESDKFNEEDSDILEELRKIEDEQLKTSDTFGSEFASDKDIPEEFSAKDGKTANNLENNEKNSSSAGGLDSEEANKLETLWEHQELIEQLKMELRKVRATGLPTILEESESPNMEELKPWKIDEKFHREDCIGELHKFYKSYRERMRKFDILNYQKMYAIGFLQHKDPLQSITTQKSSVPALTSLLSQTKRKKVESDPMMKFIRELESELEVIYVGQMCLSWEILHWQYEKALDLWESDPRGLHGYNEVAGEFQQFQVLMQRFIEDEAFQGPRVQNYVKNRCVLRNLLQVPLIREDSSKERKKAGMKEKGEYAITSDMLVEILEESIRIFWRFIRADKDCTTVVVKGRRGPSLELQDPADSKLLSELRRNLQKKERKVKDLFRSENCILRKFQQCREDKTEDQVLYFFSQVDMKLVARVLNMQRITTDHLVWCRNKLAKISFVSRKIHVESSFLIFPS